MPELSPEENSRLVADLAVERGFVTREQLVEALEVAAKLAAMGVPEELGKVLIKKGFINEAQLRELETRLQPKQPVSIGGFEILARLGRGGMGTVYKARQVSMDRIVALKVMPPALARDQVFVDRFLREARAVAQLNHPNIVQGIDVGTSGKYHYFAMEYIQGETVQELIVREGAMPERRALEIVLQIAQALHHAHRHDMVHRDIKPDNIIVTQTGVAKLCDLGLAKSMGQDSSLTQTGMAVGTPYYVSPEQARGESDVDIRSDIYSLGATLYHMVLGRTPFSGSSAAVVMTKHLTEEPEDPRAARPELSASIAALIMKMMAKDRAGRQQSPEALIADINLALAGKLPAGVRAVPLRAADRAAEPRPGSRRTTARPVAAVPAKASRHRMLVAGGVLAALAIVGISVALILSGSGGGGEGGGSLPPPEEGTAKPVEKPVEDEATKRLRGLEERFSSALAYAQKHPREYRRIISDFEKLERDAAGTPIESKARYEAQRFAAEEKRADDDSVARIKAQSDALEKQEKFAEALKLYDSAPIPVMLQERQRIEALAQSRYDALKDEAGRTFRAGRYDADHSGAYDQAAKILGRASTYGLPKIDEQLSADLGAMKSEHDKRVAERDANVKAAEAERLRALRERFLAARQEVFAAAAAMQPDANTGLLTTGAAARMAREKLATGDFQPFASEGRRIERDLKALDAFLAELPAKMRARVGSQVAVVSAARGREEGTLEAVRPAGVGLRPKGAPEGMSVTVDFRQISPLSLAELAGMSPSSPVDCYRVGTFAFYTGRQADAMEPLNVAAKDAKLKGDAEYYIDLARAAYRQQRELEAGERLRACREKLVQYKNGNVPGGDPRWKALVDELESLRRDYADTEVVRQQGGAPPEKKAAE